MMTLWMWDASDLCYASFSIKTDGLIMDVMSSFGYFRGSFSTDWGPWDDVKIRWCEGLKIFGAMKKMCHVWSVNLDVKRVLV